MSNLPSQPSLKIAELVSLLTTASFCLSGGVGAATTTRFSSRTSNRSGLETLRRICPRVIVIALHLRWPQRWSRNGLLPRRTRPLDGLERISDATTLVAWKNFSQASQPNCEEAPTRRSSGEMKQSILLFGVAIGVGLVAVSCGGNKNEVSYEIPAATGSSGAGVKAKPGGSPSAFKPETDAGR